MESKIPLPTDNIYKFYALFGLLLLVFSLGATLFVNRSTNDQLVGLIVELEALKQEGTPTQLHQVRKAIVERQIEVVKSDKKFFQWALAGIAVIGVVGLMYGFERWHTLVQPVADATAKVQLEIAQLQLAKLKGEHSKPDA